MVGREEFDVIKCDENITRHMISDRLMVVLTKFGSIETAVRHGRVISNMSFTSDYWARNPFLVSLW